jgi:4-diphosphocytidyl-2-C-methyl-D-erythritol kinase
MFLCRTRSTITVHAPAKLNLHFEVFARRDDGYHEVESVISAIDRFDTICFEPLAGPGDGIARSGPYESTGVGTIDFHATWAPGMRSQASRELPGEDLRQRDRRAVQSVRRQTNNRDASPWGDLPEGKDNLVVQAVELLTRCSRVKAQARIRLIKRIPSAAGLGGGSSDAAAALLAANEYLGLHWSRERLSNLAAELGSDVPFFLSTGAAVCRGRGEAVEPAGVWAPLHFVVIRPPAGLNTEQVYARCAAATRPVSPEPLLAALRNGDRAQIGRRMMNRLEEPAATLSNWIGRLRSEMEQLDVAGHQLTGSGSSYFAICRDARHARRMANRLRGRNLGLVFSAASVRSPSPLRR